MDNINKKTVLVTARGGSVIYDCISEAIIVAMKEHVDVELTHSAKVYKVDYANLIGIVESSKRRS